VSELESAGPSEAAGEAQPGVDPTPPVDRSDEWTGWKPVIVIVAVLGVLPVAILAIAYLAHSF